MIERKTESLIDSISQKSKLPAQFVEMEILKAAQKPTVNK
jgi:hypothetical protein